MFVCSYVNTMVTQMDITKHQQQQQQRQDFTVYDTDYGFVNTFSLSCK